MALVALPHKPFKLVRAEYGSRWCAEKVRGALLRVMADRPEFHARFRSTFPVYYWADLICSRTAFVHDGQEYRTKTNTMVQSLVRLLNPARPSGSLNLKNMDQILIGIGEMPALIFDGEHCGKQGCCYRHNWLDEPDENLPASSSLAS